MNGSSFQMEILVKRECREIWMVERKGHRGIGFSGLAYERSKLDWMKKRGLRFRLMDADVLADDIGTDGQQFRILAKTIWHGVRTSYV
jgi:hypothetical protein